MTPETLSAVAGVLLSLAFSYVPGLSGWWDLRSPTEKRLAMLVMLAVLAGAAFGLSCSAVLSILPCDKPSLIGLIQSFVAALVANQSAFLVSPARDKLAAQLRGGNV